MIDLATISTTLSTIDVSSKFIKKYIDKIKDTAIREKLEELLNAIIPLQSHIISLQVMNSACIQEKEKLEKKLREIEDWRTDSAQYELSELASGVFAYKYKLEPDPTSPAHYLCANCFNTKRKKSILQRRSQTGSGIHYYCSNCDSEIIDHSKPASVYDDNDEPYDPLTYGLK